MTSLRPALKMRFTGRTPCSGAAMTHAGRKWLVCPSKSGPVVMRIVPPVQARGRLIKLRRAQWGFLTWAVICHPNEVLFNLRFKTSANASMAILAGQLSR